MISFAVAISELKERLILAEGWGTFETVGDVFEFLESNRSELKTLTEYHEKSLDELRELSGLPLLPTDRYPAFKVPSAVGLFNALERGYKNTVRVYEHDILICDQWLLERRLRSQY